MAQAPGTSALPSPPSAGPAPGQQFFGAPHGNGSHMAPPAIPPLSVVQNNGNVPAETSVEAQSAMLSPGGGSVRRAAPEPNKRALYVGGLDPRVTEDVLKKIFETTGNVQSVKIIPDKNQKGFNYGFVEYDDPAAAERAMQTLNGRRIHNNEVRVNWAYQSNNSVKEDTSGHCHIFVGDLSNEVNDEVLLQAFSTFGTVSEARVMWDMKTGRSRGYGFVAFRDRAEAEKALSSMDGEWLGSRAIRCNWANQKGQPSYPPLGGGMSAPSMTPMTPFGGSHHAFPVQGHQSYEVVLQQTPPYQTTCYVGNLTPYTTQNDLVPLFSNFGYVTETRFQSDRGFAFIKMDTHENAANAICQLNGYNVNGRPLKCSWGKDRPPTGQYEFSSASGGPNSAFSQPSPQGYGFPQYGGSHPSLNAGTAQSHQSGHYPQSHGGYPSQQHQHQHQQQQQAYGGGGGGGMASSPAGYGRAAGGSHGAYMGQAQAGPYGVYQGYQG